MSLQLVKVGRCPACQSEHHQELYELDPFKVYQCPCGLKFIDPSLSAESMMSAYQSTEQLKEINPVLEHYYEYETLAPNSKTYRDYTNALKVLAQLTSGRDLLEVGCGRGSFLKVAEAKGWNVFGVDSSRENINALSKEEINGFCSDFLSYASRQRYDVIVFWDLIEHPQDPAKFIEKSSELLKPNGLILFASPNDPSLLSVIASWIYRLSRGKIAGPLRKFYVVEHTSYFNPKTLGRLLSKYNFQTVKSWKTETDLNRYQIPYATKMIVRIFFFAANFIRLQNRFILIARKET